MKRLIDVDVLSTEETATPDVWNRLIEAAVRNQASDIHMAAQADGLNIAFRVDGQLADQGVVFPSDAAFRLVNHTKVLAEIDLGERRRPQSGRAMVHVDGRSIDLRVSVLPTYHGQDLVIRLLDRTASLLELEQLGLPPREFGRLMGVISSPSGLILVTGPTGAGKTTTLYAILDRIKDGTRKIITIENPIEFDLPGVNQAQVNYRLDVGFSTLLRTVLQQDPDVIMIGEVRDAETAAAAVRAAVTGHLVFATTHATGAAAAIESFISLGAHPHFLARSLRGVIAQNLVRRVCSKCTHRIEETEALLPLEDLRPLLSPQDKPALAMGSGCEACHQSGYRGRVGLFEILIPDERIRSLIERGSTSDEMQRAAIEAGMIRIQRVGQLAAFLGQTTVEELLRVVPWDMMEES